MMTWEDKYGRGSAAANGEGFVELRLKGVIENATICVVVIKI